MHAVAEFAGASRRQFDGHRLMRIGEVVDIDPIGRATPFCSGLLKYRRDRALDAHASRPDNKQVEALVY